MAGGFPLDNGKDRRNVSCTCRPSTSHRSAASKATSTFASIFDDGEVVNAWTQAELFRGFEVILRDKDPQAGLVVTPRACGICGASHLTCAAWALDTAWQTEVPRNAILARNLGQIAESLQSLPRHHYGLFMIDYTNRKYASSKFYDEAVRSLGTIYRQDLRNRRHHFGAAGRDLCPVRRTMAAFELHGAGRRDVRANLDRRDPRAGRSSNISARNWIEPVWLGCSIERYEEIRSYDDFLAWLDERPEHANSDLGLFWRMSEDIGLDRYGSGIGRYVSWGYLPHEDRYNRPTIARAPGRRDHERAASTMDTPILIR